MSALHQSCKYLCWSPDHRCTLSYKLLKDLVFHLSFPCFYALWSPWDLCPEVPWGNRWVVQPLLPTPTDHLPAPLLHLEQLRVRATAVSCRQMHMTDAWERPLGIRKCFRHLFANCCHKLVVSNVWISFLCCTWGKEGKSRDTWFVLEFSVTVSHWVHYPTCIFSNAGDPVQVPFRTQPSIWGNFIQLHIDLIHRLPSADNPTTQWYHVLSLGGLTLLSPEGRSMFIFCLNNTILNFVFDTNFKLTEKVQWYFH